MTITVYDSKKAPRWVQILNIFNLFLLGFCIGKVASAGFDSVYVPLFTFYACLYALTVARFFIPKKEVQFPAGLIRHFREQWTI